MTNNIRVCTPSKTAGTRLNVPRDLWQGVHWSIQYAVTYIDKLFEVYRAGKMCFELTEVSQPFCWRRSVSHLVQHSRPANVNQQAAQLSQTGRAMPRVIEYFAKSLKVIENGTSQNNKK